jgi:5-methylcytosine-specific restriction endonuclease McrA
LPTTLLVPPPGKALAWRLAARDGWDCAYCDRPLGWGHVLVLAPEVEHRTPRARGGTDDLSNLCLACGPCNRAKATRTEAEWWDHRLALFLAGRPLPWTQEAAA